MKVTPSHQPLILTGEYLPARGRSTPGAAAVSSPGAALTRVTLVAARADDNVVLLQADYFPDQAASDGTLLPALAPALDPPPDSHDGAIAPASPRPRTLALYYARTQGSSGEARLGAYIDVHA